MYFIKTKHTIQTISYLVESKESLKETLKKFDFLTFGVDSNEENGIERSFEKLKDLLESEI